MVPENDEHNAQAESGGESMTARPLGRRIFVAGAAGVGLAGLLGMGVALAQDDDDDDLDDIFDDADDLDDIDDADDVAEANQAGAAYQNFLGKLTTNLGLTDTATVDLAIRDALKVMVDEKLTEGSISQNDADAIKERIDTGISPLGVAALAGARSLGRERRRERRKSDGGGGGSGTETPATEATPAI